MAGDLPFRKTAFSDCGALATVNGLRGGGAYLSGCVLYRRYDKRYISHYASGFGEYSNTSNEEGVYCGIDVVPVKNLKVNVYYDWFRHFAPRYLAVITGSDGNYWLRQIIVMVISVINGGIRGNVDLRM